MIYEVIESQTRFEGPDRKPLSKKITWDAKVHTSCRFLEEKDLGAEINKGRGFNCSNRTSIPIFSRLQK